jgi:hypothetical protein
MSGGYVDDRNIHNLLFRFNRHVSGFKVTAVHADIVGLHARAVDRDRWRCARHLRLGLLLLFIVSTAAR